MKRVRWRERSRLGRAELERTVKKNDARVRDGIVADVCLHGLFHSSIWDLISG